MVTHRVECPPRDKAASQPATRRLVKVLGLVVAASGVEHGLGEALQGNRVLAGPMIRSWPDSRFFRIENGEPAFTLLPHPVAAGVLTLMVAVGLAVRSWYIDRGAHPRRDLLALSALLFLVGGGFGPPLIGVALSIPAGWVRRRPVHRTTGWCRGLGAASGWLLAAAVAGWLALVPGLPLLDVTVGASDAWILQLFVAAVALSTLATVAARARDALPESQQDAVADVTAVKGQKS